MNLKHPNGKSLQESLRRYAKRATVRLIARMGEDEMTDALVRILNELPQIVGEEMANLLNDIDSDDGETTKLTIILAGLEDSSRKINVIRAVREITNLGLKEAKDLVEGAPMLVKKAINKAEAEEIKHKLEASGGKVSIE